MAWSDYHFVTHWKIRGDAADIYKILKDGENYQDWWRPAYVRTERVGEKKVRALVRAWLPYTLEFTTELVGEQPPRELELRSTGELEGRGVWKLQPNGSFTEVDFFWDVRANKRLLRGLSFVLKPLFKKNHDWVMAQGEPCLQAELERRTLKARN